MTDNSLAGRRILVTGGAGGVGRETAARMLAQGARVVSADIPGATRHAAGTIAFAGDLARQEEIEQLFALVDHELGGLDVLVACAGLPSDSLMDISDAGWRQVIDANLVSYVGCAMKAIERIRAGGRGNGQLMFVGSISVHIKAVGESVYNASKGGVALFDKLAFPCDKFPWQARFACREEETPCPIGRGRRPPCSTSGSWF